jgi:hypothetical protein
LGAAPVKTGAVFLGLMPDKPIIIATIGYIGGIRINKSIMES